MKRHVTATSLVAIALLAAACGDDTGSGNIGPTNTSSGNGNPGGAIPPAPNPATTALFQPLQGVLPYPTDIYFLGSTDGTLNIQPANALVPLQTSVNALDGFSTTAVIRTRFASPIDPTSLNASSVVVVQVVVDSATKATTGFTRKLVLGTDPATADFTVGLASDAQVGNTILEIRPLKPLVPSAGPGATNVGYLVLLTNDIRTAAGQPVAPDADYLAFKGALPTCAAIVNTSLNGLCRLTGAHLQLAAAPVVGVDPAKVVLSFSFSTQATRDTMNALAATTTPKAIVVQNTGVTTQVFSSSSPGLANVYAGTFTIPYYLTRPSQANPTAPLTQAWQGPPSQLDPTSRLLTRFNPVPVATETIQIPIFVTVPNVGVRPPNGWPALIFQHGLTRNRLDAAAIADRAAAGGNYVVVSIDLPLHGIPGPTGPSAPFYQAANERTFNLDLVNNQTGAAGPDGTIDGSGTHFVNVPAPLVTRDNLRQGAVDLITLVRSLPNMDVTGDGAGDIDPTRIHFVGHSLGGIVGGVFLGSAGAAEVTTSELAMPGGGIAQTIFDSPAFGPRIKQGLGAQGIVEGSTIYAQFIRDAQTVVDSGDSVNYIASAATLRPLLLLQVVGGGTLPNGNPSPPDQVVVNSATQRLIDAAGLPRIFAAGANPGPRGYVNFILGDHSSIINGTVSAASPNANADTFTEMQNETIGFANSLGAIIPILNPAVVQQ
jgi:pimeloyl-ACP methyl ester carboxylesterase